MCYSASGVQQQCPRPHFSASDAHAGGEGGGGAVLASVVLLLLLLLWGDAPIQESHGPSDEKRLVGQLEDLWAAGFATGAHHVLDESPVLVHQGRHLLPGHLPPVGQEGLQNGRSGKEQSIIATGRQQMTTDAAG